MIHLIGMSHGLAVANAFDSSFAAMDMRDFETPVGDGRPLPSGFETLRGAGERPRLGDMKVFLIPRQRGWGELVWVPENMPVGPGVFAIHRGFHELLAQVPQAPGTIVLSMLFGNEHSQMSIVEHATPYDFVFPGRLDLTPLPGRQVVPWLAIREQVQGLQQPIGRVLSKMRAALPAARIVHCAPPPPIESAEQILAAGEIMREELNRMGVAPASFRLKIYLAHLDELARNAQANGITLLGPPPAAVTPAGLLRPEFSRGATHGNAAYGALVLDQLEQWVQDGAA